MRKSILALALVGVLAFSGTAFAGSIDEEYPGVWRDDFHQGISSVLAANNVSGCGYFEYKAAKGSQAEYLVRCGGSHYIVYLGTQTVSGPYRHSSNSGALPKSQSATASDVSKYELKNAECIQKMMVINKRLADFEEGLKKRMGKVPFGYSIKIVRSGTLAYVHVDLKSINKEEPGENTQKMNREYLKKYVCPPKGDSFFKEPIGYGDVFGTINEESLGDCSDIYK